MDPIITPTLLRRSGAAMHYDVRIRRKPVMLKVLILIDLLKIYGPFRYKSLCRPVFVYLPRRKKYLLNNANPHAPMPANSIAQPAPWRSAAWASGRVRPIDASPSNLPAAMC